jgi:spore coat protein A, manganese oxidase
MKTFIATTKPIIALVTLAVLQQALVRVDGRALAPGLLDPDLQPKFVENVPEALSDAFTMTMYTKQTSRFFQVFINLFRPFMSLLGMGDDDGKPSGVVTLGIYPIVQETGIIDPATGKRLKTPLFGYGKSAATASWPGPTFEVKSGEPITVRWTNELFAVKDYPFTSLVGNRTVVDETLHWAYSMEDYKQYSIANDGIPMVVHLHGIAADEYADGYPEHFFSPGFAIKGPDFGTENYLYPNDQQAGNLWYHDHALGITRLNVYAGLAGLYFIRDDIDTGTPFNTLGLPSGDFEKAYAIQDKMFKTNGELFYPAYPGEPFYDSFFPDLATTFDNTKPSALTEFFGDFIVVNGKIWPKQRVRPTSYRFRLLNGCDTRYLVIRFLAVEAGAQTTTNGVTVPYTIVGSDQGLLNSPVSDVNRHILTTGSRSDVVIDFTPHVGKRIIMTNEGGDIAFRDEIPGAWIFANTKVIMAFDVDTTTIGDPLVPSWTFTPPSVLGTKVRRVGIFEARDSYGRLKPLQGGELRPNILESFTWTDPLTEIVQVGTVEEWDIFNFSTGAVRICFLCLLDSLFWLIGISPFPPQLLQHPIHLHYVHFQVVRRNQIQFDEKAVNRICSDRGAESGVCLKPKNITDHDGKIGVGYEAYMPSIDLLAIGRSVETTPDYIIERGQYKDTVTAIGGQVTRIRAKFDRRGRFVWHCHFLSHEDHEMMRVFQVV